MLVNKMFLRASRARAFWMPYCRWSFAASCALYSRIPDLAHAVQLPANFAEFVFEPLWAADEPKSYVLAKSKSLLEQVGPDGHLFPDQVRALYHKDPDVSDEDLYDLHDEQSDFFSEHFTSGCSEFSGYGHHFFEFQLDWEGGFFVEGAWHQGSLVAPCRGWTIEGSWFTAVGDTLHYRWANGAQYVGEYQPRGAGALPRRFGRGTLSFPNGAVFTGVWEGTGKYGTSEGHGRWRYAEGLLMEGALRTDSYEEWSHSFAQEEFFQFVSATDHKLIEITLDGTFSSN